MRIFMAAEIRGQAATDYLSLLPFALLEHSAPEAKGKVMDKCQFCKKEENLLPTRYYDVDFKGYKIPTGQKRVMKRGIMLCGDCSERSHIASSAVGKWLDEKLRPT
jgi:hypothetical protein